MAEAFVFVVEDVAAATSDVVVVRPEFSGAVKFGVTELEVEAVPDETVTCAGMAASWSKKFAKL